MRRYFIGSSAPASGRWQAAACPTNVAKAVGLVAQALSPASRFCSPVPHGRGSDKSSRGFQALGDFLLRNRAALDDAPIGLGDIDGGGALAGTAPAIEDQIDAAIHHTENVDAAMAGGMAGDVGAGGNQWLVEEGDQPGGHFGARMA